MTITLLVVCIIGLLLWQQETKYRYFALGEVKEMIRNGACVEKDDLITIIYYEDSTTYY